MLTDNMSDSEIAIKVENLSKQYRLGTVGTGTISHDLNRWWAQVRGKEDPFLKIGETNDRSKAGNSDYVWSLKDINFEVKQGEVLGIIGKNGAGKSTLLKILSKVTGPTTGRISAKGRIGALLEVGTGFHPELTGRENIFLNGAILGMTKVEIRAKLDEIIDFSGCARYVDTPVKRYSSGMKVRLAFAVAAFLEPEILIVDEVLAVGDAEFQKKAIGKMQDVSKGDGRTVLFVSHNMAAVENLCSSALVLDKGMIRFNLEVKEAIDNYLKISVEQNELLDFKSRIPNGMGNVQISHVDVYPDNESRFIKIRDTLVFDIDLSNKSAQGKLDIGIRVFNERETNIFSCSTLMTKTSLFLKSFENNIKVLCRVNSPFLIPGRYFFSVQVNLNNDQQDRIERVLQFEVLEEDFYSTGSKTNINKGEVLVDHVWIKNEN
nr:ABC transporter ATP-binding protein [Roseivirga spongicola]